MLESCGDKLEDLGLPRLSPAGVPVDALAEVPDAWVGPVGSLLSQVKGSVLSLACRREIIASVRGCFPAQIAAVSAAIGGSLPTAIPNVRNASEIQAFAAAMGEERRVPRESPDFDQVPVLSR